jgi:hypothetical protein
MRDILFYQANFEPEVCRMLDAKAAGDQKYFDFFQMKTIKIVDEILKLADRYCEKEEWSAIRNLVTEALYITEEESYLLRNYGNPFSIKFSRKFHLV